MIEEILVYEPKVQEFFSLHQLISFYIYSYKKLLSKDSPLIMVLTQLETKVWQHICTLMTNKINKSNYNTLLYSMDSSPLPIVQEYISIMSSSLVMYAFYCSLLLYIDSIPACYQTQRKRNALVSWPVLRFLFF